MKVRLKFAKYGVMKYIGHLDIMRYFQKCMRKGGIDIAYSTGYSPHQIMSFASPLGVGVESYGEYFDIELNSGTANDVLNNLNNVMVPGMEIISVVKLPDGVKNAMASIAAAKYRVFPKEGFTHENTDTGKVADFLSQSSINIIKQTKKNEIEFDLKPHIYSFAFDGNEYSMLVDASSSGNIKPQAVIEKYGEFCNMPVTISNYQIVREEIYTEENGSLVSLESLGEDF